MVMKPNVSFAQAVVLFTESYGVRANLLEGWQQICEDCGIEAESSVTKCKKALKAININILDLINARNQGRLPRRFASKSQLAEDLKKNKSRRFPLKLAKENGFMAALLVEIR